MEVTADKIRDKKRSKHLKSLIETADLALYRGNEALDILQLRSRAPVQGLALFKATRETAKVAGEFTSEGMELGDAIGSGEISALMLRHAKKLPEERAVFKDYRWLDDLLVATSVTIKNRISTERFKQLEALGIEQRKSELKDINKAMLQAVERQKEMHRLLKKYKGRPEYQEHCQRVEEFAGRMLDHIPQGWLKERKSLSGRIRGLCATTEQRALLKNAALSILDEAHKTERELEFQKWREFIESVHLKSFEYTIPYFDKPFREPSPKLVEAQQRIIEKIVNRARLIRDYGGTIKEVEDSMGHIPPQFWPPEFVRSLQAWRKVERELEYERLQKVEQQAASINASDIMGLVGFALDSIGFVAITTDLDGAIGQAREGVNVEAAIPCSWRGAPAAMEALVGFTGAVQNGYGLGAEIYDLLKAKDYDQVYAFLQGKHPGEFGNMSKAEALAALQNRINSQNAAFEKKFHSITQKIESRMNRVADAGSAAIGVTTNAVWAVAAAEAGTGVSSSDALSMAGTSGAGGLVPVLCAVGAGIDLTRAIVDLGKAISLSKRTGSLQRQAEIADAAQDSPDGGALVMAICNGVAATKRKVAKESVNVTSKGLTFAGELTLNTGIGVVAGLGLKVAGKSVEYAGKIVFAGIDWGRAKDVKAMIKEARDGNPMARMQLMKKSGLYAKMYIGIMAREGNPIARKYVVDRGLSEADIDNPAIAISVLRDAMLNVEDQRNEEEVSDNLAVEVVVAQVQG